MEDTYSVNKEAPKEAKKYKVNPVLEGALLGIFALCLTFITAYFIYTNSMKVLEQEIKDGLLRMVSGMAACIDGDLIETFREAKDAQRPEYRNMIKMLQKARIGTKHCSYIYINTVKDDKIYFLLDPISVDKDGNPLFHDAASLEESIPMTLYEDAYEELIKAAFFTGEAAITDKIYTDKWGTFHSAYAPIYDKNNKIVGTLGADLRMDDLNKRCKPMEDATKRAFIVSVSLALLLGTFVWFTRRFTFMLNESRQSIYQNFLVAKRFADQTSNSLGNQYQRTSSILKYAANKLDELSKLDSKEKIIQNIDIEERKLNRFAEKLLTLGELKYSNRKKELDNFSLSDINKNIIYKVESEFQGNSKNVDYECDQDIPHILYGPVISYEELLGHLYDLCIGQFDSNLKSKTILVEERSKDVVLKQEFSLSTENFDEEHLKLAKLISKNIATENWEEQMELSESINIPIIQELLYVLGANISAEIKDSLFVITLDFVLLKSQED